MSPIPPPAPFFVPSSPQPPGEDPATANDEDDASRYSAASARTAAHTDGRGLSMAAFEERSTRELEKEVGEALEFEIRRVLVPDGQAQARAKGRARAEHVQPQTQTQTQASSTAAGRRAPRRQGAGHAAPSAGEVKLTRTGLIPHKAQTDPGPATQGQAIQPDSALTSLVPARMIPFLTDSPSPTQSARGVSLLHEDLSPAVASSVLMAEGEGEGEGEAAGESAGAAEVEVEHHEELAFVHHPRPGESLRLRDSEFDFDEGYARSSTRPHAHAHAQASTDTVAELPPAPPYRSYASTPPVTLYEDGGGRGRRQPGAMSIAVPREVPSVSLSPQRRSRGWRQTLLRGTRTRFRDVSPGGRAAFEQDRDRGHDREGSTPPYAHYSPGGSLQPPTQSFLEFQSRKRGARNERRRSRMSRDVRRQSQYRRTGHGPYIHNWEMPTHWTQRLQLQQQQQQQAQAQAQAQAQQRPYPYTYRYDPANGSPRPDERYASAYAAPQQGGRLPTSAFSPTTPSCRQASGRPGGRRAGSDSSTATPHSGTSSFASSDRVKQAPNFEDLFFDLLFVANLAVYAEAQQLTSLQKVQGFLAYFCLLWWTWYSHSLFDVRFRTRPGLLKTYLVYYPQLLNRLVQVGIWVAFTTTGGQFVRHDFASFSQIYALNRLSLALDYLIIVVDKARGVWRGSDVDGFAVPGVDLNGQPLPLMRNRKLEFDENDEYPETKHGDRLFKAHRPLVLAMMGKIPQADVEELPSPLERAEKKRREQRRLVLQRCLGPAIGLAASSVSAFIWYMSSHIHTGFLVTGGKSPSNVGRFVIWGCATLTEIVLLFFAEWKTHMVSLRHTQICERLALFAIVIIGEGFSTIGNALNTLSPGLEKKATSGDKRLIPCDGWDMDVVMQATATVLVLCFSFVTYYRDAMLELRHSTSLTILGWSFLHVVYFAAAALLAVGLKRLICFHSTISAFTRFMQSPALYLPDTPLYANYTTSESVARLIQRARTHANATSGPMNLTSHALDHKQYNLTSTHLNLTSGSPETHIFAIISVIEGFDGVTIPSVEQAVALVKAAAQLVKADPGPSMQLQLPGMTNYVSMLKSVKFIEVFIREGLFQFKYVYLAGAAIYISDCLIKGIAVGRENLQQKMPSLMIRFWTGVLLSLMQITYFHYTVIPSWAALNGGVPILAGVMCAEIMAQLAVQWFIDWRSEVRARASLAGKLEEEQRWAAKK